MLGVVVGVAAVGREVEAHGLFVNTVVRHFLCGEDRHIGREVEVDVVAEVVSGLWQVGVPCFCLRCSKESARC